VQAWFIVNLTSQNGRILLRLEALEDRTPAAVETAGASSRRAPGLTIGSPAPEFSLDDVHGESITLAALRAASLPVMLIFSDPSCGPCSALMPDVATWQRDHGGRLTIAVVSRGELAANRATAAEHGLTLVLLQKDREVASAYRYPGTPSAVLVGADGTIASAVRGGAEGVRALLAQAVGSNGSRSSHDGSPAIGQPAPPFSLTDLSGTKMTADDLRGRPTLLLFWNPGCGFCQQMLNDLKRWEADASPGAPRLLVVSTGSPEANRAMGLSSRVVLDEGSATMRAFAAYGTPMAVLLDADLTVASPVVAGAPAVLELAAGSPPVSQQQARSFA
jgi:peroxiredoxin